MQLISFSLFQLFEVRNKVLKEGAYAELWELANANVMSDVETDDEGPAPKRVFRRPAWRSEEFNNLVGRIDAFLEVERNYGEPSERRVTLTKMPAPLVA